MSCYGLIFHLVIDPNTAHLSKSNNLDTNLQFAVKLLRVLLLTQWSQAFVQVPRASCQLRLPPTDADCRTPFDTVGFLNADRGQNAFQNLQTQGKRDIWFINGIFSNLCLHGSHFPGKNLMQIVKQEFIFPQFRGALSAHSISPVFYLHLMTVSSVFWTTLVLPVPSNLQL